MKQKLSKFIFPVIVIVVLGLMVRFGFTVVTIESAEQAVQSEAFDPAKYVDEILTSTLLPAYEDNSISLADILKKISPDINGIVQKETLAPIATEFGLITVGESHVYMVKSTGKVTAVNTESSTGTIEIQLDDYQGPIKVLMYIGSRIPSDETSVRDAGGFISFGDFKEQTEYGKVASEINKRVLADILGSEDKSSWVGKTISFTGAFSIRTFNLIQIDMTEIRIVPTSIELGD
jgi:predicted lipoprotein